MNFPRALLLLALVLGLAVVAVGFSLSAAEAPSTIRIFERPFPIGFLVLAAGLTNIAAVVSCWGVVMGKPVVSTEQPQALAEPSVQRWLDANLARLVGERIDGIALGEATNTLLEQHVTRWLGANLPAIVEAKVESELERISQLVSDDTGIKR